MHITFKITFLDHSQVFQHHKRKTMVLSLFKVTSPVTGIEQVFNILSFNIGRHKH